MCDALMKQSIFAATCALSNPLTSPGPQAAATNFITADFAFGSGRGSQAF